MASKWSQVFGQTITTGQLSSPAPVYPPAVPFFGDINARKILWTAFLLENLQNMERFIYERKASLTNEYGAPPSDISVIVERLRALCFPGHHRLTMREAWNGYVDNAINPYMILHFYVNPGIYDPRQNAVLNAETLWQLIMRHDYAFPWNRNARFVQAIGNLVGYFNRESIRKYHKLPWREREEFYCLAKLYFLPSWPLIPIDGHYVHISTEDPSLVAYTSDEKDGERDIHRVLKPGRYLQKYYPELTSDEVRHYAAVVTAAIATLKFAITGDEIHRVFTLGPQSCMSATDNRWASTTGTLGNPVRAYGNSDLQVAYIEEHGKIIARAVVWPEKKVYGVCYGDRARFDVHMANAGYHKGGSWCFEGARIRCLKFNINGGICFVVPHFDCHGYANSAYHGQFDYEKDANGKEWLRVRNGGRIIAGRGLVGPYNLYNL